MWTWSGSPTHLLLEVTLMSHWKSHSCQLGNLAKLNCWSVSTSPEILMNEIKGKSNQPQDNIILLVCHFLDQDGFGGCNFSHWLWWLVGLPTYYISCNRDDRKDISFPFKMRFWMFHLLLFTNLHCCCYYSLCCDWFARDHYKRKPERFQLPCK